MRRVSTGALFIRMLIDDTNRIYQLVKKFCIFLFQFLVVVSKLEQCDEFMLKFVGVTSISEPRLSGY